MGLLFVATAQIAIRPCPQYRKFIIYSINLVAIGMLSILLDANIIDTALSIKGHLLPQFIASTICAFMFVTTYLIFFGFLTWARNFYQKDERSIIQFMMMLLSAIAMVIIVLKVNHYGGTEEQQITLLREVLFMVMPSLIVIAGIFGELLKFK